MVHYLVGRKGTDLLSGFTRRRGGNMPVSAYMMKLHNLTMENPSFLRFPPSLLTLFQLHRMPFFYFLFLSCLAFEK